MNKNIKKTILTVDKKPVKIILRKKKTPVPPSKTLYSKYAYLWK